MIEGKGNLISTSASSLSRLSPLAPPFIIKTPGRHENASFGTSSLSGSALGTSNPFSQLSLDDCPPHAYHSDATSIAVVPLSDFDPISDFHGSAEEDYSFHADVSSQTSIQNDLWKLGNAACGTGVGDSMAYGAEDQYEQRNMFLSEGKGVGLPKSGYILPKKGLDALQGLRHAVETTTVHGTGTLAMAAYDPIRFKDTGNIHSKISCLPFNSKANSVSNAPELLLSATLYDTQGSLSYSKPVVNSSYCISNFTSKETYSKHKDSCVTQLTTSHAPHPYPSPALGLSSISVKPRKPICNEVCSPSKESFELQAAVTSVEPRRSKASVSVDETFMLNDHNDSDLDSPCWKGKLAYHSPFQESEPMNSHLSKHETVARNSLNPLAPQFFPVKAKKKVDQYQTPYHGCNSFSFQNIDDLASVDSSMEDRMCPVKSATSQTEGNNLTRTRCSNDVVLSENEKSSMCSSRNSQPHHMEEHNKSNTRLLRGGGFVSFLDSISDMAHDRLNTSLSLNVKESQKSPSPGVDIFSCFAEISQGPSKSNSDIDTESLINVMLDLSNFLLLKCSNVDLFNESEHDKVQNIINNLYVYTRNRAVRRFPLYDSGHLSSSYGPMRSADYYKTIETAKKENTGLEEKMHPEALMYRKLWLETVSALSFNKNKYNPHLQQ